MLGPIPVISYSADEGAPLDYGKELLVNHNLMLDSLTWTNKGANAAYIQIFNTPRKLAIPITNTSSSTDVITAPAHGLVTGDKITLSGITGVPSGYALVGTADAFRVTATRALALAAGAYLDLTVDGQTGTVDLASNITNPPIYEEYPVLGVGSAPSNIGSYTAARFTRGLYARAVTAQGGSTLVPTNDVKFTARYASGPIMGGTYED